MKLIKLTRINDEPVYLNHELITAVSRGGNGTEVYVAGVMDDYFIVQESLEDVIAAINGSITHVFAVAETAEYLQNISGMLRREADRIAEIDAGRNEVLDETVKAIYECIAKLGGFQHANSE
jgi:uncharacterized protein YlzI (FlbEa/FlbD family)